MQLYKGDLLVDQWLKGTELSPPQLDAVSMIIEKWRERLYSLEWFMRGMNETIARMANQEENCKGRFYVCHPWQTPFGPAKAVQIYSR